MKLLKSNQFDKNVEKEIFQLQIVINFVGQNSMTSDSSSKTIII